MHKITRKGKPNKYTGSLTLKHAYKDFKKEIPKGSLFDIDYATYRNVCLLFNEEIMRSIIEEAYEFEMPGTLGTLRIKKSKMRFDPENKSRLVMDWKTYNETGEEVKHLNEHSNGYFIKWLWSKFGNRKKLRNKSVYCFIPVRKYKRWAAHLLKQKAVDYFE